MTELAGMSLPILPSEADRADVRAMTRQLAAMARAPRIVKLELILTEACNLGCSYCFEYKADHHQTMSPETARGAVDFLCDASRDSPWVGISFMGGEPMLRFDIIREIVEYSRERAASAGKAVSFDMQTNGLMIREEHARFFRDVGLQYCLSLDGAQVTHDRHRRTLGGSGTFQIVARKMTLLKRYQHWQGARMTVMPESAGDLATNIVGLHEELAINQFVIGFATHVAWDDRQIANYARGLCEAFDYYVEQRVVRRSRRFRVGLFEIGGIDQAHDDGGSTAWGCGAGSGRLAVAPSGIFHGCSKLTWGPGGSRDAPLPLGSVETGISRPENRLRLLDHTDGPRTKCRSCEIASSCQGGCHAAHYADTGDIYTPADYFCKLMFAQKFAGDYARGRIRELGLNDLFWDSDIPDLTDPRPKGAPLA